MSAYVCADDNLAVTAVQLLLRANYKVPQDIAMIGINDSRICRLLLPRLSSVNIPLVEDAKRLAEACLFKLKDKKNVFRLKSEIYLVERESS